MNKSCQELLFDTVMTFPFSVKMASSEKGRSPSPGSVSKLLSNPFKKQPTTSPVLEAPISPTMPENTQVQTLSRQESPVLSPQTAPEPVEVQQDQVEELQPPETQRSRWNSILFWTDQQQPTTATEDIADEDAPVPLNQQDSMLWAIPNHVSRLSGLFIRQSSNEILTTGVVTNDQFLPNTISSIKTASQIVNVTTNGVQPDQTGIDTPLIEEEEPRNETSWFTPWKWGNTASNKEINHSGDTSDTTTLTLDDDESKLFRKLVVNSIQCLSYGIEKPSSWGMFKKSGDDVGEVRLTGNKSCKRGVLMKRLPKSNFEIQEELLSRSTSITTTTTSITNGNGSGNGIVDSTGGYNDTAMSINEAVVLPDLKWNYRPLTMLTKTRIISSRLLPFVKPEGHLYTLKKSRKRPVKKKVTVISIHGFLPQKFTKSIANECSGTSRLMLELTNRELDRWGILNNVELEIDNIQLEGYGKIFERMNDAMSIIENWATDIQTTDYLLVVCNSNSVTVGVHLMAKMIVSGMLKEVEKLGILGISGMTLGPIPMLEGKILTRGGSIQENEMISEMFDFEDPESLQSKELIRSFNTIIKANCKVSLAGSLMDCISPMYSSLSLQFGHANIFRMIYIESGNALPDFLVSLFNTVLALKNLTYSDHGLLVELSKFFEGKPQMGGHSRVLMDKHVYRMGISNVLDTNNLQTVNDGIQIWPKNVREMNVNPYHIPWCLRGVLEELVNVKPNWEVDDLMTQLTEEFNSWDGENGSWQELRKCMEAFGGLKGSDIGL